MLWVLDGWGLGWRSDDDPQLGLASGSSSSSRPDVFAPPHDSRPARPSRPHRPRQAETPRVPAVSGGRALASSGSPSFVLALVVAVFGGPTYGFAVPVPVEIETIENARNRNVWSEASDTVPYGTVERKCTTSRIDLYYFVRYVATVADLLICSYSTVWHN